MRFVLPNRQVRIGSRADAAKVVSERIRSHHGDRPLLLTKPGSVNWRTGGLSDPIDLSAQSDPAWVLDSTLGNALITSDIEAPRLERDFDVMALGWEVIPVPWFDADAPLEAASEFAGVAVSDLLSDAPSIGEDINVALVSARLELSEAERDDLRDLGRDVGVALGAGMDAWRPGKSTDFDIAATISASLERNGAHAVCLIVGGDERLRSFRHPLAVGDIIHDALMAVVVGRRGGLHVAATRISVRKADDEIVGLVEKLASVNDAVVHASLPGGTWGESIDVLAAAYKALGYDGAWREHYQGGPIGFEQREFELAPPLQRSPYWNLQRSTQSAVAWNPSLRGGAKIEETYLLGDGIELLTSTPSWPMTEGPAGVRRSAVKVLR